MGIQCQSYDQPAYLTMSSGHHIPFLLKSHQFRSAIEPNPAAVEVLVLLRSEPDEIWLLKNMPEARRIGLNQ